MGYTLLTKYEIRNAKGQRRNEEEYKKDDW